MAMKQRNLGYNQESTSGKYDAWSSDDLQCVQAKDEQEALQGLLQGFTQGFSQKVNSWCDSSDDLCYDLNY